MIITMILQADILTIVAAILGQVSAVSLHCSCIHRWNEILEAGRTSAPSVSVAPTMPEVGLGEQVGN